MFHGPNQIYNNLVCMAVSGGSSGRRESLQKSLNFLRRYRDYPIGQGIWATFKAEPTKLKTKHQLQGYLGIIITSAVRDLTIIDLCKKMLSKLAQIKPLDMEIRRIREDVKREIVHETARQYLKGEKLCPSQICQDGQLPADPHSSEYHMLVTHYLRILPFHPSFGSREKVEAVIENRLRQIMPERIREPESEIVAILRQINPMLDNLIQRLSHELK